MIARANDNCFEKVEVTEETPACERIVPQAGASRAAEPETYIWGMMPDEDQPFFARDESAEQFAYDGSNFDAEDLVYFDTRHFDPTPGQYLVENDKC